MRTAITEEGNSHSEPLPSDKYTMYFTLSDVVVFVLLTGTRTAFGEVESKPLGIVDSAYTLTLDVDEKFNVSWTFTGHEGHDEITFTVEVETTGWVGLGFSPQGSMAGADIIMAWVDQDSKVYLQDMMAVSNGIPTLDEQQDVQLIFAKEVDGKTTVKFSRQVDTCDSQDNPLKTDTTRLIYAYGTADPSGDSLTYSEYHGPITRGSKSVYLFDPQSSINDIPEGALSYDVLNLQYEVPSDDTTYYCSFHQAPPLDSKHHLIANQPIITEGNEGVVHHMILYACWNLTEEHMRSSSATDGDCFAAEMPEFASSCKSVIFGWAVGGAGSAYPEGTGYPIGGPDSPEYFLLQTHYDNPGGRSGMVDSSGIRLIYTPILRDIEVGTSSLGATFGLMIPPHTKDFEVTTYCHSNCTSQWIPDGGITVFSYLLHAHLLGVQLNMQVYRTDGTIEQIAADNSYDFNFQETRLLQKPKKIYPGDTLKLTCTMDSSDRTEPTLGGESTREEMCFAFISYYPRANLSHCGSIPAFAVNSASEFYSSLHTSAVMFEDDPYNSIDLRASLVNISWDPEMVDVAQEAVSTTPHMDLCFKSDGTDYENPYGIYTVDVFPNAVYDDDKTCVSSATTTQCTVYVMVFLATLGLACS